MMHPRAWGVVMAAGAAGLAASIPSFLPPLAESLLVGFSLGMIVVGPVGKLAEVAVSPRKEELKMTPAEKLRVLTEKRSRARLVEHERVLNNFDALLSRVEAMDDPEISEKVTENFQRFVERLTRHYPQWDPEGRLRTYVLMNKIAEFLDVGNADTYLDLAYRTLVERGAEATELSRITLNGKVERIYRNPKSERSHHLAGTLLLMNREDGEYAKEMVSDAIHLWSERRFAALLPDFKAIWLMSEAARREVEDMIEKDMAKARTAGDVPSILRSREILETITESRGKPPRASGH